MSTPWHASMRQRLSRLGLPDNPVAVAAIVAGLALLIRLLHIWQISAAPFFSLKMGDAHDFHLWAQTLAAGDWVGRGVFYHAPLYPYFLGVTYALFGEDPVVLRVAQALLGSAACGLVTLAGWRLFSKPVGIVSGLLLACYAPAIFFDSLIQDSVLDLFLACLLLWLLTKIAVRHGAGLWLAAGAALGTLMLTRENAVVLALPITLWIALDRRAARGRRVAFIGLFILGWLTMLSPVAVRNKVVGGEFHLTTFNLGANLYIGNNPAADGYYHPLRVGRANPLFEERDAVRLAERAVGRDLAPAEVSRYWMEQALGYIVSQPVDWLRLLMRKAFLAWNATEVSDTEDQYTYAAWSLPLRLTGYVLHFGIVAPLAVLGVWITWADRRRLWPFYLMPAIYLASVVLFFVFARYRYPVVPFLGLLAAAGLVGLPAFVRTAPLRTKTGCFIVVAAVAVVGNWPTMPIRKLRAATEANVGATFVRRGEIDRAIQHFQTALALNPESAEAHYGLGAALHHQEKLEEAIRHYAEGVRLAPNDARIHNNHGVALTAVGSLDSARAEIARAVQLDPLFAEAYVNLGDLILREGDLRSATTAYRLAVDTDGRLAAARLRLANALIVSGDFDEAFQHYVVAGDLVDVAPAIDRLLDVAWSLATDPDGGDAARSLAIAERVVEDMGRTTKSLRTLAAAYAATGRYDEAVRAAEAAIALAERADDGTASLIRKQLESYRQGRPALP